MTTAHFHTQDAKQALQHKAKELGFCEISFAKAEPLQTEAKQMQEWLNAGHHGTMGYLERNMDKREDVRLLLPSAQTVIVVAYNYYTPVQHESNTGKISRYAWGDDYHEVIPPKLDELINMIRALYPESESRRFVDTAPVMEKQWAVRAGIGWQGKHSNIISRNHGSYFFLGVILTSVEFEVDNPIDDYCGTCTACIDACPTQAIIQPHVVDGTKCISYWTIEAKPDVEFPLEIVQHLDGWAFGCDVCQDVCPWNRFKKPTQEVRFLPRNEETTLNISAIENMQQEEFSTRFRKSPIKRTKLAGLLRNIKYLKNDE
ncbi:MAG: tRNA epoxyqueuosine(34) reductase QueG [Bacteriodetes bacterium]|nr:tRNA epoxyqueuosine(34) reductase QueG [Bacteroidota bacterium]